MNTPNKEKLPASGSKDYVGKKRLKEVLAQLEMIINAFLSLSHKIRSDYKET